ncbi:calcium-dependent protein kinase CDPK2B [Cardiosporidium cionae]|uniref:Calcium-dependent protein kinase CDPK2B n=1 Tax=Cardiosporidium cionae TaxID=476202 RepID=A0ABQ7J8Y8_9APIC|nr:calcium-dependent protein kinase CDPK2B [Cardiosporidium cionae]|eukprot:KAF8820428.1 calcium-dependent protein kinase CDPK2B [Cardiosporidium cionae]
MGAGNSKNGKHASCKIGPKKGVESSPVKIGVNPNGGNRRLSTKVLNALSKNNEEKNLKASSGERLSRSNFIVEQHDRKVHDDYVLENRALGQGTYGSVVIGKDRETGVARAIKTISKNQLKNLDRFRSEISIMKALDHPNIIKLFQTYEDHRSIYLVMELCQGGELFDRIIEKGHFTERHAAILMKQIFSALHYLHSNYIMHRDLKPENFLFLHKSDDSALKIIDFGLSCRFKPGTFASTKAGTPYYVAPQVLQGCYDYTCDYWSSGVIMYILLCGYPPFYGETDAEVLEKVRMGTFYFSGPEWKRVSDDAKNLIRRLLRINPQERCSAEQALQHEWIHKMINAKASPVALPTTLLSNLKGFHLVNRFKKAALTIIAQHLSDKDISNLRDIFVALDVDHSGTLSLQELSEGLLKLGWTEFPSDLKQVIEDVDSDKSGFIDYTEFLAATIDKRLYINESICWEAFRVFDLDGNGKISSEELRKVLGAKDVESIVGHNAINTLINEADLNGDGEIDFDEFMHMMRRKPEEWENALN